MLSCARTITRRCGEIGMQNMERKQTMTFADAGQMPSLPLLLCSTSSTTLSVSDDKRICAGIY